MVSHQRRPRKPRKTRLHPALRSPDMKEENPEHQNGDPSSSPSSSSTARSPEFLTETKDQSSSTSIEKCRYVECKEQPSWTLFFVLLCEFDVSLRSCLQKSRYGRHEGRQRRIPKQWPFVFFHCSRSNAAHRNRGAVIYL